MVQRKLALNIDENIHEEFKIHSVKTRKSMGKIVEELIREYLKKQERSDKGKHEND
jgi:hypothetical protein